MDWIAYVATFLSGVAVGVCGQYLADRFTDQRRKQESDAEILSRFARAKRESPDLIAEMQADCRKIEHVAVREFVLLDNEHVSFWPGEQLVFFYFRDTHPSLDGHMSMLQNLGFIERVESSSIPKYRMTEEFIDLLRSEAVG